jgi:hypothetical protein
METNVYWERKKLLGKFTKTDIIMAYRQEAV